MKKKKKGIVLGIAAAGLLIILLIVFGLRKEEKEYSTVSEKERDAAFALLSDSLNFPKTRYQEYLKKLEFVYGLGEYEAQPENGVKDAAYESAVTLDYQDTATYYITVEKAGVYSFGVEYLTGGTNLSDYRLSMTVNGESYYEEMAMISLPLWWQDETKEFPVDRYGDETVPEQVRVDEWRYQDFYNTSYYTADPLYFYLESGVNKICLENVSADGLKLGTLYVTGAKEPLPSYQEYRAQKEGTTAKALIEINSVSYTKKNSSSILMSHTNNPALKPHNSEYKELNTLAWWSPGCEVVYEFEVEQSGYYQLAFHYKTDKEDFSVFETIKIDGEVPFAELKNYAFVSTDSWKNEVLSGEDGEPFEIWLEKGSHTISIRAEQEPVTYYWRYTRLISEHVTQLALEIKKITGENIDENRTWHITKYLPDIVDYLEAYATLIRYIQQDASVYSEHGYEAVKLEDLDRALEIIDKVKEYPDEIPLYLENLTGSNSGNSILKVVGDFSAEMMTQHFALDRIYVYGKEELPKEEAGVWASLKNGALGLLYTFTSEKYRQDTADEDAINIWVNRSVTQVDLLQKMADTEFTPETGIKVKISVMPDASKLAMATAANETPDMALGIGSAFELTYRDALYDMTQFEDFWEVADRVAPGMLVPYIYNEGIYGFPETTNFSLVIYRKDIFEQLEMKVPDTWEDLIGILPKLQRYGMNFYHDIATTNGYKYFSQTVPLIYQNGGKLYSEDGLHTLINQPEAVNGIKTLGELFSIYSMPTQVASFMSSFRYNICPIGIVNLDAYLVIKNGATELEGQWAMAPYLGTEQEDGSIDRSYIAGGTAGIIFEDTEYAQECWEFLKWWMSADVQSNYAYSLQLTFGESYVWLSANTQALENCTLPMEDKQLILDQMEYLTNVPRTPGDYMLERSLSNIWNDIAIHGSSAQVAIDARIQDINRELLKKMSDIGFVDTEGNQIKEYTFRDVNWIIENIEAYRKGEKQ